MRNLYGRRWGRKTRILLITGTASEVEQLTPGLTAQLWQEDRGTLLLWGGDLNTPADSAWLTALRKLRRRPVDGLVWVTSAFDQLSAPGLEPPLPVPSESTMDSLSHAISARMDNLAGNSRCMSGPCTRAPVSRKGALRRRPAVCCLPVVVPKGWQSNSPP
jgi:type VI secretion system protein ImpL